MNLWPPQKTKTIQLKSNGNKFRVAFILRGGMAKIGSDFVEHPEDIYRKSEYIDYKACARSIRKHIFENNDNKYKYFFDTFIHSWNVDLEKDLVSIYQPKLYSFEDNDKYKQEILTKITDNWEFPSLSSALSIKKGIELMQKYEISKNFKYDIVIIYRPDLMLWKDMNLDFYASDISKQKIFVNGHTQENGDFHFLMSSDVAKDFKNLYESRSSGNKCICHFWIKNYIINYMKRDLIKDEIIPGQHQEVARKLKEYSILPKYITIEKLVSDYNYNLALTN